MSATATVLAAPPQAAWLPQASVSEASLRVLTLTTLYPSVANPRHGIFVETRLAKLRAQARVDLQVVAPVPWFPVSWKVAGRYATYAATPARELRDGVAVRHPRFVSIPRVGMALQPSSLAAAALRAARELLDEGWSCDVIDAHYLYPDGVAAAQVARALKRPFVVTARGSDVNLVAQMPAPRRRILASLEQASRVIAVSEALKSALIRLGVAAARIEVLRNGVDTDLFRPDDRQTTRARLGVDTEPLVLSVGNLVVEKGHDLVLRSAHRLDGSRVIVVGRGPERANLVALADRLGMRERVRFLDNVSQAELASVYGAADVLALGSTREGWPNVLLEAIACGTPVVAMAVGGVQEIITNPVAGVAVTRRDEGEFAAALQRVLDRRAAPAEVRAHALGFSWQPVVHRYFEVLAAAAKNRGG